MKKISIFILSVILCVSVFCLSGCVSRHNDFYDFDLGMTVAEVKEQAKKHDGKFSNGSIGNRYTIEYVRPENFPSEELKLTMYMDDDTLDLIVGVITFTHEKDANKDKEFEDVLNYFKSVYGEGKLMDEDKYKWTDLKSKDGKNDMEVELEKKFYDESYVQKILKSDGIKNPSDFRRVVTQISFQISEKTKD